jgi:hypothetical protein
LTTLPLQYFHAVASSGSGSRSSGDFGPGLRLPQMSIMSILAQFPKSEAAHRSETQAIPSGEQIDSSGPGAIKISFAELMIDLWNAHCKNRRSESG